MFFEKPLKNKRDDIEMRYFFGGIESLCRTPLVIAIRTSARFLSLAKKRSD